jgi:hypothetical protein
MLLNVLLYPGTLFGTMTFVIYAVLAVALATARMGSGSRRVLATIVIAIAVANVFSHSLSDWRAGSPDAAQLQAIRSKLAGARNRPLFIDEVAARYVYDYRLPSAARAWTFSRRPPGAWPLSADERLPGSIWLVGLDKGDYTRGLPQARRFRLGGIEFRSIPDGKRKSLLLLW